MRSPCRRRPYRGRHGRRASLQNHGPLGRGGFRRRRGRHRGWRTGSPAVDLSGVTARKVLVETAFFFPTLLADSNGVGRMEFNMPEALTRWRFLGFAHDRSLRSGFLADQAVTAKELMIQPNPPRFLRGGDELEFTVRVQNQSDQPQTGKVRLSFQNAWDASSADALLGNRRPEVAFEVPARQSRSYAWKVRVPDAAPFLTYKAVGATDKLSDGEEGYLPVLSRRVLITIAPPPDPRTCHPQVRIHQASQVRPPTARPEPDTDNGSGLQRLS